MTKQTKKQAKRATPKRGTSSRSKSKPKPKSKPTITKKIGVSPDISYSFSDNSVTVNFPANRNKKQFVTKTYAVGSVEYERIKAAIREGKTNQLPKIVMSMEDKVKAFASQNRFKDKTIKVEDGAILVKVDNEFVPVPLELGERITAYAEEGLPYDDLIAFFNNLIQNPSRTALNSLYRFLAKNHFPITPDGYFIAYKGVTDDFKDLRTKNFDNSIGKVVKVRRNEVDEDINIQCSFGLHIASYKYAHEYYGSQKVIEVKVNPKNVVAVPIHETDEKMRVCEYKVIGLSERERTEQRTEDYPALQAI